MAQEPFVYVLYLEQEKYYIGYSKGLEDFQRLHQHFDMIGAAWTQKYPPICLLEIIHPGSHDLEKEKTLEYMTRFGWENVRGAGWTQTEMPHKPIVLWNEDDREEARKRWIERWGSLPIPTTKPVFLTPEQREEQRRKRREMKGMKEKIPSQSTSGGKEESSMRTLKEERMMDESGNECGGNVRQDLETLPGYSEWRDSQPREYTCPHCLSSLNTPFCPVCLQEEEESP